MATRFASLTPEPRCATGATFAVSSLLAEPNRGLAPARSTSDPAPYLVQQRCSPFGRDLLCEA